MGAVTYFYFLFRPATEHQRLAAGVFIGKQGNIAAQVFNDKEEPTRNRGFTVSAQTVFLCSPAIAIGGSGASSLKISPWYCGPPVADVVVATLPLAQQLLSLSVTSKKFPAATGAITSCFNSKIIFS